MKRLLVLLTSAVALLAQSNVSLVKQQIPFASSFVVKHVELINLANTTGPTLNYTLQAVPIINMGATFFYTSSVLGQDVYVASPTVSSAIIFTLPTNIAFTSQDTITVEYWSLK